MTIENFQNCRKVSAEVAGSGGQLAWRHLRLAPHRLSSKPNEVESRTSWTFTWIYGPNQSRVSAAVRCIDCRCCGCRTSQNNEMAFFWWLLVAWKTIPFTFFVVLTTFKRKQIVWLTIKSWSNGNAFLAGSFLPDVSHGVINCRLNYLVINWEGI